MGYGLQPEIKAKSIGRNYINPATAIYGAVLSWVEVMPPSDRKKSIEVPFHSGRGRSRVAKILRNQVEETLPSCGSLFFVLGMSMTISLSRRPLLWPQLVSRCGDL